MHFIWSLLALLGRLSSSCAHTIHLLGLDLCVLSVVKHAQHPDDDLSCFSIPHFLFAFIRTPLSFSPLFISIWLIPYTPIWSQPNYAYKHKMIKLNATCKVKSNVCCSSEANEREREMEGKFLFRATNCVHRFLDKSLANSPPLFCLFSVEALCFCC